MEQMDMRLDTAFAVQQSPVISHRQIIAVRLLQMPSQELTAAIARERDMNPAFEVDEREQCFQCGAGLDGAAVCPACGASLKRTEQSQAETYDGVSLAAAANAPSDEDGADPILRVASVTGRGETLLQLLCATLPEEAAPIAEYLVGSLDHHGYLPENIVDDAADALDCDPAEVELALQALQRMDPPGIGARGAAECLLIQLRRLREGEGQPHPLAELLVRDHLTALAMRRFREVAHALGVTPRAVEAEWQFIRDSLHPFPTHGFDPDFATIAETAPPVRPDVIFRMRENSFQAEVVERQRYDLRVNREYQWARKHIAEVGGDSDRAHIRSYVEQAQSFIAALRQRWETMQRVSDALIELQGDFLQHGQSALKPLTRADVARRLNLHESTVSRATDGKFALLPNGRAIPFDDFFDSSLPVKKALRELIAAENPRRPFSDEQIARLLEKKGFAIARRTIAKYREEIGILPSRLRRQGNQSAPASQSALASQSGVTPKPVPVAAGVL